MPALVTRDTQGNVSLLGAGKLAYSYDGTQWTEYSEPFALGTATLLYVRNTTTNGQSVMSVIPFAKFVDRSQWKVTASSFENGEGNPEHILDGSAETFWHSRYSPQKAEAPHSLVVDMGKATRLKTIVLTPRNDMSNGRVRQYEIYLSDDGQNWGQPALKGSLPNDSALQYLSLANTTSARYIKLVVLSDHSRQNFGALAELSIVPVD